MIYHRKITNLSLFGKMIYFSISVGSLHSNRGTNCPPLEFGQSMAIVSFHHSPNKSHKPFKTSHPLVYFVLLSLVYFASIFPLRCFKGMMLRGTMEVLTDAKSKEMIWREGDTEYYPGGVTDPNYCVLKFTATDGRFYSDFYPRTFVL